MAERLLDEILARRAQDGDHGAFEELFHAHKAAVLNFIYRMMGNRETAEEVAQDVFMKAFRNLYLYDPNRNFLTWLYAIARNQTKNAIRDKKYFKDVSLEAPAFGKEDGAALKDVLASPEADPSAIASSEELEREAQRALDSMPSEYKEVIALCSVQGLTYEEAAKILGCSTAMVAVRLHKAKELFMKKLGINIEPEEK